MDLEFHFVPMEIDPLLSHDKKVRYFHLSALANFPKLLLFRISEYRPLNLGTNDKLLTLFDCRVKLIFNIVNIELMLYKNFN